MTYNTWAKRKKLYLIFSMFGVVKFICSNFIIIKRIVYTKGDLSTVNKCSLENLLSSTTKRLHITVKTEN